MVPLPLRAHDRGMDTDQLSQNKQLVEAFIRDLFTKGDLDAVDRYLDPGFVNHDAPFPGAPDGPEGMRMAATTYRRALPDWHSDVEQLIAEDDLVVEVFTASGTHDGELMGVPGTGKTLTLRGVNIFRIRHGRIVERWGRLDQLAVLQQLGLFPAE
jgi:steroid delta-isomerase-like uncharacterized protein